MRSTSASRTRQRWSGNARSATSVKRAAGTALSVIVVLFDHHESLRNHRDTSTLEQYPILACTISVMPRETLKHTARTSPPTYAPLRSTMLLYTWTRELCKACVVARYHAPRKRSFGRGGRQGQFVRNTTRFARPMPKEVVGAWASRALHLRQKEPAPSAERRGSPRRSKKQY